MKTYRQQVGKWGEKLAEDFLVKRGMSVLERNYRTQYGEIDLIMQDGDCTVFVEVKTRKNLDFGLPEESITRRKVRKLIQSAETFFQQLPERPAEWRIDVVAVIVGPVDPDPEIMWFENVSE